MAEEVNYKPALTKFPCEGSCFDHTKELFDYLMSRECMKHSKLEYEPDKKGLVWSENSMWTVTGCSGKTRYTMEQLWPFIPHLYKPAKPVIEIGIKGYCVLPNASTRTAEEIKEYFGKLLGRQVSGGDNTYYHYPEFAPGKCSALKIEDGYKLVSFPEFIRLHEKGPLTPEECYPPAKWCVKITPENNAALTEFLLERKDEWKGCSAPENWKLTNDFFFFYPQFLYGCISADGPRPEKGYTLIGNIELVHIFANLKKEPVIPKKWAVIITDHNQEQLKAFLDSHKDEWEGYMPSWYPIAGDYFTYPQHTRNCFASRGGIPQGFELVPFEKIKHVLTDKQTISTNINLTIRKDGTETIKVQGPHLTIGRADPVRAITVRCATSKIKLGVEHRPDRT